MAARKWAALAAVTGMSACTVVGSEPETIEEFTQYSFELQERLGGLNALAGSDLPSSGSARFEGVLSLSTPDGSFGAYRFLGNLDLEVPFAPGAEVTGRADGFVEQSGGSADGTLTVAGGAVDRTGDAALADARLTGTLTYVGRDIGVNREMSGVFHGTSGGFGIDPTVEMIVGTVRDAGPVQFFGGSFIVER